MGESQAESPIHALRSATPKLIREILVKTVVTILVGAISTGFFWNVGHLLIQHEVDILVRLPGLAAEGDVIEIFPLSERLMVTMDSSVKLHNINFSDISNRQLEVRLIRGRLSETLATEWIGSNPLVIFSLRGAES